MYLKLEDILAKLPNNHRTYENLYGEEYWLIPAIVWWMRPQVIVELGTDKLTSARMICGTMPKSATFFTVDILRECAENVERAAIKAIAITGDSVDVGKKWELPFELLYIDARHEIDSVFNELTTWSPKVTKCILLHDILSCAGRVDVAIAKWIEDPENSKNWEYIAYEKDCGMGVLMRRSWWNNT